MTAKQDFFRIEYHDNTGHTFMHECRIENIARIIEDATDFCIPGEGFTIYRNTNDKPEYCLIRKSNRA